MNQIKKKKKKREKGLFDFSLPKSDSYSESIEVVLF